jgi:TolB-like protein
MSSKVFISHSSADFKNARAICDALEKRGLPCWISARDVGPGEDFQEAIVQAIRDAGVMVLVFTENTNNSAEIKKEVVLASQGNTVIIPARVENVAPIGSLAYQLATRQWVDLFIDWDKEMERLGAWVEKVFLSPDHANQPRLSIVVLPFANIGGNSEQEYFIDGVTESLTTDLSRIAGSFVIARNTAFTYKGKSYDVTRIGHELNVRYVLEGSVQRGSNRIRVNVQLIDAQSGAHLWAERFDKPSADFFELQDEIVARLANALNAQLVAAEARRAKKRPHPDSMDLYFEGMSYVHKGQNPDTLTQARAFFEQAFALDSGNLEALVGMAMTDTIRAGAFLGDDRLHRLAAAETALDKALSLAPNHALAHYWMGAVQIYSNRAAEGIAECQRALELDRNLAIAHGSIGFAKYVSGRGEETEAHVNEALRLSPRDTYANLWMTWVGAAKQQLELDEEAIVWIRRAIEANRNRSITHFILAASLAQMGRLREGRNAAQAGLALDPTFTISRFRTQASNEHSRYLAGRERVMEGMRQAGVPEG